MARSPVWFVAAMAAVCLYFWTYAAAPIYLDDSMITLHCVNNALTGKGLVFNEGQYQQVYSNPGFAVTLLALGWLGIEPITAAYLVFHVTCLLMIVFLGLVFGHVRAREAAPIVALIFFSTYHFWHSLKGMETTLLLCLSMAALFFWLRRNYVACGVMAAWATLCRPDAIVIGALLAMGIILKWRMADQDERKNMLWGGGAYVLIGAVWAVFALLYYGDVLPQSVRAKQLQNILGYPLLRAQLKPRNLEMYAHWTILLPLGVIPFLWRDSRGMAVGLGWGVLNLALLLAGGAPYFHWYVIPAAVSLVALGVLGGFLLIRKITPRPARVWLGPGVSAVIIVCALWHVKPAAFAHSFLPQVNQRQTSGRYIANNSNAGDRVAAVEVGFVGFYSQCEIIDILGLASQGVHPFLKSGDNYGIYLQHRPEWIVGASTLEDHHARTINYEPVLNPGYDSVYRKRAWLPEDIWNNSPELAAAILEGQQVILLDWPEIARDPAEFSTFVQTRAPSSPPPVYIYSGAIEEAYIYPEAPIFSPRAAEDGYVAQPLIRKALDLLKQGRSGMIVNLAGARVTEWNFDKMESWAAVARHGLTLENAASKTDRYFRPTQRDPHLTRYNVNISHHARFVLIEYSFQSETSAWRTSEIFFTTRPGDSFTAETKAHRQLRHDGEPHIALYDLDPIENYASTDMIVHFRWDPVNNYFPVQIRPRSILFCGFPDESPVQ